MRDLLLKSLLDHDRLWSKKNEKPLIDEVSATIILQDYLSYK